MEKRYCEECKKVTETVVDHEARDTVCSECGIILESNLAFTHDESDNNNDLNPVEEEEPWNPVLNDIPPPLYENLHELIEGFKRISTMCDTLGLVGTIKDHASDIFITVNEGRSRIGGTSQKRRDAILASCLYVACRQSGNTRSGKEICSAADQGITLKELYSATEFVDKKLKQQKSTVEVGTVRPGDYMARFCSKLGSSDRATKAAIEVVEKVGELDIRRAPSTIAAGVMYVVSQLSDDKKELKDVAVATGVAEGTIKQCFKDLYPHLSKIIPNWFAAPDIVNKTFNEF